MKSRSRRPHHRPQLELLEDRCVPAVFAVGDQTSLHAAILTANGNGQPDTVRLLNDIALTGVALPAFTADGGNSVLFDGDDFSLGRTGTAQFRILHNRGAVLTVEDLTVTEGVAANDGGGGIYNESGQLSLNQVTITGNQAVGATAVGGGVYNAPNGTAALTACLISGNHSDTFGGGLRNQGLILQIADCTFSGNAAATEGGGAICNFFGGQINQVVNCTLTGNSGVRGGGVCNHGQVTLANCTIVGNSAQATGGGIENDNVIPLLQNCIVAGNTGGDLFPNAPVVALNNLIGGAPQLGPLQDNGGPTATMAPLAGSPAIGAGTPVGAPSTDQRGYPRPVGGPVDLGAFQTGRVIAVGSGRGAAVNVLDSATRLQVADFQAYETDTRGVRVAVGDVNGDGVPDIITAPGPGRRHPIRLYRSFDPGAPIADFHPFGRDYRGGVFVAMGNFDADPQREIVTGQGKNGSVVRIFDVANDGQVTPLAGPLGRFRAFGPGYRGGVTVAAGDFDGQQGDELIVGKWRGSPRVHVLGQQDDRVVRLAEFTAFAPGFAGGVTVAAADLDGDNAVEILAGMGFGGSKVRVLEQNLPAREFTAYTGFEGGVRVATLDVDQDGVAEIVTSPGPGREGALIEVRDAVRLEIVDSFFAFDPAFRGGAFVGGG